MSAAIHDDAESIPTPNSALFGKTAEFVTYIREVARDGGTSFAVCSDDGAQLALFATKDAAYFTARQFNLTPFSVH